MYCAVKIDFQDGRLDLGFPIRIILAIFDLQVTLMLPIFRVLLVQENMSKIEWQFSSGSHFVHLSRTV